MKRQEKCYLACLNVLKLVDKKYAWIVRPESQGTRANGAQQQQASVDLDCNDNVDIVGVEEVNRSYMATCYMIKLASISQNQSNTASFYSTDEIVALLVKFGLFDDALIATGLFKRGPNPMGPVFVGLVDR